MKVALLGIVHESNTFVQEPTTLEHFRAGHWLYGNDIVTEYRHAFHEIGGMLEAMETAGIEVVPVMYAEATPGGRLTASTLEFLVDEMMKELEKVMPVDGCLVVPHGAGVAEGREDMDGYWLQLLREKLGPDIPIVGTIDPHANCSTRMVEATNALVAYKTNPHIDQRKVGWEAGRIMAGCLSGGMQPVQVFLALPFAISIEQQLTVRNPCKDVLHFIQTFYNNEALLSASLVLGFPYADVEEMGSSLLVITNNEPSLARQVIQDIAAYMLQRLEAFNGPKLSIEAILPALPALPKPVLLLDMGDNVGGGAPGNSTFLLEALEKKYSLPGFICLFDPDAVSRCWQHELGDYFDCQMGLHPLSFRQLYRTVKLVWKGEGVFSESAPRHGGQVSFDMGDTAILSIGNHITVMLISKRTPPFSLQQLLQFGLEPEHFGYIVAKGVNAPIAAYKEVCPTMLQIDTPGVTQADMTRFLFTKRRKPLFPFESIHSDAVAN